MSCGSCANVTAAPMTRFNRSSPGRTAINFGAPTFSAPRSCESSGTRSKLNGREATEMDKHQSTNLDSADKPTTPTSGTSPMAASERLERFKNMPPISPERAAEIERLEAAYQETERRQRIESALRPLLRDIGKHYANATLKSYE